MGEEKIRLESQGWSDAARKIRRSVLEERSGCGNNFCRLTSVILIYPRFQMKGVQADGSWSAGMHIADRRCWLIWLNPDVVRPVIGEKATETCITKFYSSGESSPEFRPKKVNLEVWLVPGVGLFSGGYPILLGCRHRHGVWCDKRENLGRRQAKSCPSITAILCAQLAFFRAGQCDNFQWLSLISHALLLYDFTYMHEQDRNCGLHWRNFKPMSTLGRGPR